jgi:large subunit ribosomal protein L24
MKIKKNDNVIVIAGKDKGTKGKVLRVLPSEHKVIVEGVNKVKKHIKYRNSNKKGEIIEKSMPMHISNVAIVDPKTNKPSRVGYIVEGDKKVRIAKKSGQKI